MFNKVLTDRIMSITDLKKNTSLISEETNKGPILVLNRSAPAFYMVSEEFFNKAIILMEMAEADMQEDIDLAKLCEERKSQKRITVKIDEL